MYSSSTLSGTESTSFWVYWDLIKNRTGELLVLGPRIQVLWQEAKNVWQRETDPQRKQEVADQISELSEMYITWTKVKDYIHEWGETWSKIAGSSGSQNPNLGLLPLILPAWALASLAAGGIAGITFVAVQGLSLISQYQEKKLVVGAYGDGTISEEQLDRELERINKLAEVGFFEKIGSGIGSAFGFTLPMMVGIGALIFFGPTLYARYK